MSEKSNHPEELGKLWAQEILGPRSNVIPQMSGEENREILKLPLVLVSEYGSTE